MICWCSLYCPRYLLTGVQINRGHCRVEELYWETVDGQPGQAAHQTAAGELAEAGGQTDGVLEAAQPETLVERQSLAGDGGLTGGDGDLAVHSQ